MLLLELIKMSLRENYLFNSLLPDFAGKLCVLPYDHGQTENVLQQKMDSSSVGIEKCLWIMLGAADGQSPSCQCSLTVLNYVSLWWCLHGTFSGESRWLFGGVCKERISLLCGNSSLRVLRGHCQMLSVGHVLISCRYTSRPTKGNGIKYFKDRDPYSSILPQRNMNSWSLKKWLKIWSD